MPDHYTSGSGIQWTDSVPSFHDQCRDAEAAQTARLDREAEIKSEHPQLANPAPCTEAEAKLDEESY